jgi:hypothetical protein
MEYRKITSPDAWVDLWLGKFSTELAKLDLPQKESASWLAIVKKYLEANHGNPRTIPAKTLKKFLTDNKTDTCIPALHLFYDVVARSDEHLTLLAKKKK